jgi:SAM-dependent methyltransferase
VDRDAQALAQIVGEGAARAGRAKIHTNVGDFTRPLDLPPLDGVVIANALHYVPYADQARVLRHVAGLVSAGGPLVVVEYERRNANQWVPYPITSVALAERAREAGLGPPTLVGTQPSRYSGTIYSVVVRRP